MVIFESDRSHQKCASASSPITQHHCSATARALMEIEFAQVDLQRGVGDVLERQPRQHSLYALGKETHRYQQARKQLDQPILGPNQRQNRFQGDRARPDHKIDRAHQEKTSQTPRTGTAGTRPEAGPRIGNISAITTAVGAVNSPNRNADSPIARLIHIHSIETGLIKSMAILPSITS